MIQPHPPVGLLTPPPPPPQDSKGEKRNDGRQKRIVWKCDCGGTKTPRKDGDGDVCSPAPRERPSKRQGCPFQVQYVVIPTVLYPPVQTRTAGRPMMMIRVERAAGVGREV